MTNQHESTVVEVVNPCLQTHGLGLHAHCTKWEEVRPKGDLGGGWCLQLDSSYICAPWVPRKTLAPRRRNTRTATRSHCDVRCFGSGCGSRTFSDCVHLLGNIVKHMKSTRQNDAQNVRKSFFLFCFYKPPVLRDLPPRRCWQNTIYSLGNLGNRRATAPPRVLCPSSGIHQRAGEVVRRSGASHRLRRCA